MGYYSQVVIGISKKAHEKFLAYLIGKMLKGEFDTGDETPFEILKCAEKTEYENAVVYKWSSIKWYSEFKSISAIEAALDNLDNEEDSDEIYIFVRVGEESDDIETRGYFPGPPYIYTQTTIVVDG